MAHRLRSLVPIPGRLAVAEGYRSYRPAAMANDFVFVGAPAVFNPDRASPVNPARLPHVNKEAAVRFAQWLTSPPALPTFSRCFFS